MFGREPVLWLAVLRAIIVLATSFGLDLSVEQTAAVYLVLESVLSLAARQQVTPVSSDGSS